MKYQLIIKIPFEALDDVEAREKAKLITENYLYKEGTEQKLQRVYPDKPPVGVNL